MPMDIMGFGCCMFISGIFDGIGIPMFIPPIGEGCMRFLAAIL
jgi:hypothetical protein